MPIIIITIITTTRSVVVRAIHPSIHPSFHRSTNRNHSRRRRRRLRSSVPPRHHHVSLRTHLASSSSYTPRAPSRRRMPTSRRRLVVGRTNEWLACARVRLYGITLAITRACVRGRWCASHGGLGVDCMGRGVSHGSGMSCACARARARACVLSRLRVGYVVCVCDDFVTVTGRVCRVRAMILSRLRVGYFVCVR